MNFQEMDIKTLEGNPWKMIGDDWMLVAAKKDGQVNAMTASWGGVGIMWGKTAATIYLRPQRYTKEFVDANDTFTLSFFRRQGEAGHGLSGKSFRKR